MPDLVLDDLAHMAGTTGRNIRALQSHCLVRPPRLVGRTGFYGAGHLDRVRAVLRLQDEGFTLRSIAVLFGALDEGRTLEQVLGTAPRPAATEEEDLFVGWPSVRKGQLLSAVPSTLVAWPAA